MADSIIGIMWNYNEADILAEIIEAALPHVDSLFIADDESTDGSWNIIQQFASEKPDKIEYTRHKRVKGDKGQRAALLSEVRRRYKPENTLVQVIESDVMILDTDIREAWDKYAVKDVALTWQALNACRSPGDWDSIDTYPNWGAPIKSIMPKAHWMETMLYTFRPLPKLHYTPLWRPWPRGFSHYSGEGSIEWKRRVLDAPLLAHYGYRGPTHFYKKYGRKGHHRKYTSWNLETRESIEKTVFFFNGQWTSDAFPMSREGYISWRRG